MEHIAKEDELSLLLNFAEVQQGAPEGMAKVTPMQIIQCRQIIEQQVTIAKAIMVCLVEIAEQTRRSPLTLQGISTRSLVVALSALRVRALLQGRTYVSAEDVQFLAPMLFAHRMMMARCWPCRRCGQCLSWNARWKTYLAG